MDEPLVSVVVTARNAAATIPALLDCLAAQTLGRERFEVVVVDDASTDDTAQVVRDSGLATVLSTDRPLGDAARNLAVRAARGKIVAITDADCRPVPQWLEYGVEDLDRLGVDMVGGHVEVPLPERPSLVEQIDFSRFLDQERAIAEGGFAATANLFLRCEVFDRAGRFNERLIAGGDREFCLRATDAGCTLAYSPRAAVVHPPHATARGLARRAYRAGIGRAQVIRHGDGPARAATAIIWMRPGAYKPSRRVYGVERLERHGRRPGPLRRLQLSAAQWGLIQLPMVWGNFLGFAREARPE
jgi:glycosyltransferase involved in cell wall biosynthesis